jgi:hypothetical protein
MGPQRLRLRKDEVANLVCGRPSCNKKLGPGRIDRLYCSDSCRMKNREMDRVRFKRSELSEKLCPDCLEVLDVGVNGGKGS